jgi:hypothetical protein
MRRFTAVLLLALVACGGYYGYRYGYSSVPPPAVAEVKIEIPEAPPTIDGGRVIQTWGRGGMGHACPVSPTEAYTADHIAILHRDSDPTSGQALPITWGDRYGNSGTFVWVWSDLRRDLSFVRVMPETSLFSGWFSIADKTPRPGDHVIIVGYDFEKGMVDKPLKVHVTLVQAGHIAYDDTPGPGSSGSCILNELGEVVGINVAMVNGNGIGVLLTEGWASVPDAFRQRGE